MDTANCGSCYIGLLKFHPHIVSIFPRVAGCKAVFIPYTYFGTIFLVLAVNTNSMKKLLLAGLAAYAYHRYTKMSPAEKTNITNKVKETGRKFSEGLPSQLKDLFAKRTPQTT